MPSVRLHHFPEVEVGVPRIRVVPFSLLFSGVLVAGRIGDLYGAKRPVVIGLHAAFGVDSRLIVLRLGHVHAMLGVIVEDLEHVREVRLPPIFVVVWLHVLRLKWLLLEAAAASLVDTWEILTLVPLHVHHRLVGIPVYETVVQLRLSHIRATLHVQSLRVQCLHRSVTQHEILLPITHGLVL